MLVSQLLLNGFWGGVALARSFASCYPDFERGINISGGEYNPNSSSALYGTAYIYPSWEMLSYYAERGFSVVRVPFRWERVQPILFGDLDETELNRIKSVVEIARALHLRVILSPHNYGRYFLKGKETLIGEPGVPIAGFADFFRRFAAAFAGDSAIYALSLMNEPHAMKGRWREIAQTGLDAIRSADFGRLVLAPGDEWSGAWSWRRYNNNFLLNDTGGQVLYEAHQYFDTDRSGTYRDAYPSGGASEDRGVELVRPFIEWLQEHKVNGIITELGVPNNDARWLKLIETILSYLANAKVPWVYWAGGPWWGDYALSTEPKNGVDAPIMAILTKKYARRECR